MKGYKKRSRTLHEAINDRNRNNNAIGRAPEDSLMEWQMDRLAEECSELIQAVMKVKRYPGDAIRMANLWEELSHVRICSDIVLSFIGKGDYNDEMDKKLSQLERSYATELKVIENLKHQA